jgi:hypothetical protein
LEVAGAAVEAAGAAGLAGTDWGAAGLGAGACAAANAGVENIDTATNTWNARMISPGEKGFVLL